MDPPTEEHPAGRMDIIIPWEREVLSKGLLGPSMDVIAHEEK
jgi:hypothetical protein